MKLLVYVKGGPGSGNFDHCGIEGHQGGSKPAGECQGVSSAGFDNPPAGWKKSVDFAGNHRLVLWGGEGCRWGTNITGKYSAKITLGKDGKYAANVSRGEDIEDDVVFDDFDGAMSYVTDTLDSKDKFSKTRGLQALQAFEKEHWNTDDMEWSMALDKNGKMLFDEHGDYKTVAYIPEGKQGLMKGGIFTHTHPGALSFSVADVNSGWVLKLQEIRATMIDGDKGKVARLYGTWPKTKKQFGDALVEANKRTRASTGIAYDDNLKGEAATKFYGQVWKHFADVSGMTYKEETL